jgi:hypothetical protein
MLLHKQKPVHKKLSQVLGRCDKQVSAVSIQPSGPEGRGQRADTLTKRKNKRWQQKK